MANATKLVMVRYMPSALVDRVTYIVDACRGMRVLHLGCTDWPYTKQKLAGGALLHARIHAVATSLVGIDSDQEGVACFRQLGFAETYVDNVENFSRPEVLNRPYDIIVAGEIIEHLENCGLFLRAVQRLMSPRTELVLTTVNAYCFFRFVFYLFGREMVHPDHNYYFSPAVLRRLLTRCGLDVTDSRHYPIGLEHRSLNPRRIIWLDDLGRRLFPRASDGIIFKAQVLRTAL